MTTPSPEVVLVAKALSLLGITYFVLLAIFAIARVVDRERRAERRATEDEVVSPEKLDELRGDR